MEHAIETGEAKPVKTAPRCLPYALRRELKDELAVKAEDSLYLPLGTLSALSHAFRLDKCTSNIPNTDDLVVQWQGMGVSVCLPG